MNSTVTKTKREFGFSIIEEVKFNRFQKEFPKIRTAGEALEKAIQAETEAKKDVFSPSTVHWFQLSIDLQSYALLLEKKENN